MVLIAMMVACIPLATGCAEKEAEVDPFLSSGEGMMADGGGDGESMVLGVVATSESAQIDVRPFQQDRRYVQVERVVAPADGWLLARSVRPIGSVLGATPVVKGVNRGLKIALNDADSKRVRVTLHTDGGRKSELEFDPDRVDRSPDRAVYVDRAPLEAITELKDFGVEGQAHEMSLWVEDQRIGNGKLRVRHVWVPRPAWLAVATWENERPRRQVALRGVDAENVDIDVQLEDAELTDELVLMLIADGGERGIFEYDYEDPLRSADQPYSLRGDFMRRIVRVR